MAYHPQSSKKVERINRTLKLQLEKLYQETLLWDQLLSIALLKIRCSPTKWTTNSFWTSTPFSMGLKKIGE
jgi:hypothetical protein